MSVQTIGSAFIAINPDTSKTGAAVNTAMGAIGKQAGTAMGTGLTAGVGTGVSGVSQQMSKFSGVVRQGVGGALGPVMDLTGEFSGLGQTIKQNGAFSAAGFASIGTGAAGAGIALMALGSAEKQAHAQLAAAITATGQAEDDFRGKIEETTKADEKFGITSAQTDRALQTLVTITGDTGRATDLMGLAANLAAARHISLTAAATQVGKAAEGNTRLFKMYGITVGTNADGTKDLDGAMQELSKRLDGQASASVSGFTGHLKVLGTVVEDHVAQFGQKYGPAITAAGSAMVVLSLGAQGASKLVGMLRDSTELSTAATEADIAVTEASTAAVAADASMAGTASAAETALAGAESRAAASALAAGGAAEQLALFNTEVAATAEEAAVAEEETAAAGRSAMMSLGPIAAIAVAATAVVGFAVNRMMSDNRKIAAEGKAAFDSYWSSVTGNRSQTNLQDLIAEQSDLSAAIDKESAAVTGVNNKSIVHLTTMSKLKQAYDTNAATIKTYQDNVAALGDEFHLSASAVEDLANKNNVNLGGSMSGLEKKFQEVLGGTEEVIQQTASLSQEYGVATSVIKDFTSTQGIVLDGTDKTTQAFEKAATAANMYTMAQQSEQTALADMFGVSNQAVLDFAQSQKIVLDGTDASNAKFQAAVKIQQDSGSATQILTGDYDKLYSALSSVKDKEDAFQGILDQLIGTQLSAAQAADAYQQKINDMGTALDKSTHSITGTSDAAINNRKVIEDLAQSAVTAAENIYKQTGSIDQANAAYDDYYQKTLAAAAANGVTETSVNDLLGTVNALPDQVATALGTMVDVGHQAGSDTIDGIAATLTNKGAMEQLSAASSVISGTVASQLVPDLYSAGDAAGQALQEGLAAGIANDTTFQKLANQVDATANRVVARYRQDLAAAQSAAAAATPADAPAPHRPGRATGGTVSPGATYIVGERGPETLVMGQSASGTINPSAPGFDLGPMLALLASIDRKLSDGIDATNNVARVTASVDGSGMTGLISEIYAGRKT